MRIAYVCADAGVPVFGCKGCSIHVQEVIRALCRLGIHVELFTPRAEGAPPAGLETVPVHRLPSSNHREPARREQDLLAANDVLRIALESNRPWDLVYERYSLWSHAAMAYSRSAGIPGLLEVNAPLIEEQAAHRILVDHRAAEAIAESVFGIATALVAVSEEVAVYLAGYPAAQGRIHVVHNGVNAERFRPRTRVRSLSDSATFTVGFVGSLKSWHGLPVLVEAFARLHGRDPDSRLLVVGEGPERARLLEELDERGLCGTSHLTGTVPPDEVPAILAEMDAAVAPYAQRQGFYFSPLKVYEYMAAGLPVAASAVGQLTELIRHGVNGLLCPPGDAEALAAALQTLRGDPELRRRLGQQARATILGGHTWGAVVRRILALARPSADVPLLAAGCECS